MFALDICDEPTGRRIFSQLLDKGYIVCKRGSVFRIDPPLIIYQQQFDVFIEAFKAILPQL